MAAARLTISPSRVQLPTPKNRLKTLLLVVVVAMGGCHDLFS
jgi:hypothetical protein